MKKVVRKTIATVAAVSMMLPMVASCGKSGSGNGVVSEDTPWYNMTTIELDSDVNKDEFDQYTVDFVAKYGDKFVFRISGIYKIPADFDYLTGDLNQYMVDQIAIYNSEGNKESTIDVQSVLAEGIDDAAYVNSVVQSNEGLLVTATAYGDNFETLGTYRAVVDVDSGTVGEFTLYTNEYADELEAMGAYPDGIHFCEGYAIEPYWLIEDSSFIILITDPDGNVTKVDLRETFNGIELYNIGQVIDMGNNKALAVISGANDTVYAEIDLSSKTLTQSTQDYSWTNLAGYDIKTNEIDGYGLVLSDGDTLSKLNFETNSLDTILDYTNTSVNRDDASSLVPISVSDDRIVLTGSLFRYGFGQYSYENVMIFLDKAESNPHAGKTILTLAPLNGYTYPLCDAVIKFNDSNENYFVTFDTRYYIDDYMSAIDADNLDYVTASDQASTNLGNQLTVDLMGGNGPDIIIDGFSFNQLNNPDYLVDLNDYVTSELTADNYYMNVIDTGYVGGGIYQLPVTFSLSGIVTDESNVSDGQIGFTYDEYETFVDTVCNGTDPLQGGRVEFFITSINSMMDLMVDDNGNFNFDNEAFRALAEYTRDFVNDGIPTDDMAEMDFSSLEATVSTISTIGRYFDEVGANKVLLGYPSYDARGPLVSATVSVGVSSQSSNSDGGMEFVKFLMTSDVQQIFSSRSGIPVNRAAFNETSADHIQGHNEYIDLMSRYLSESEMRQYGINTELADEATAQELSGIIDQLQGYNASNDGAVNAVIREEIPAFFEGQKTLDQVIQVLQDRAQTVVSERR